MPLYEYQCGRCGRFELIRKFSDPALEVCPTCGGEVQKQFSAPAIQFKGTGWYVTDYARKSPPTDGASQGGETAKGGETSQGKEASSASGDGKGGSKDGSGAPKTGTTQDGSATGSSPAK